MTFTRKLYLVGIGYIRKFLSKLDMCLMKVLNRIPGGARVYYSFFNRSFSREMKSTLEGKLSYDSSLATPGTGNVLLRRNIHRLEKGLSMKERRELFALDYIGETLNVFLAYRDNNRGSPLESDEYPWFRDVLAEYFRVSGDHPKLNACRTQFESAMSAEHSGDMFPYQRDLETPLACNYEALMQLVIRRRSVRWFLDKKVPRDLIEKAMEIGLYSPSACNRQPFSFRVFDDSSEATEIAKLAMGTAGYEHQIPCTIVVIGHLNSYFSERDRHVIYIDGSLAVMPFMMACETLGLATCAINWPDIESREKLMAKRLNLNPWERPIMQIAIGYPDPLMKVPRPVKKSVKEMIKWRDTK